MIRLSIDGLTVESYETGQADAQLAAAACTPTLDSLVDHLCPDGITVGCHEPLLAE